MPFYVYSDPRARTIAAVSSLTYAQALHVLQYASEQWILLMLRTRSSEKPYEDLCKAIVDRRTPIAQELYDVYRCNSSDQSLPYWEELFPDVQKAWEAVATHAGAVCGGGILGVGI